MWFRVCPILFDGRLMGRITVSPLVEVTSIASTENAPIKIEGKKKLFTLLSDWNSFQGMKALGLL